MTLSFSSSSVLLFVALPLAVAVAIWAYRRTTPAVSNVRRGILAGLRAIVLVALVMLLGEPILSFLSRIVEPPVTVVLIDNSRSMAVQDIVEDRRSVVGEVLSSDALARLQTIGARQFVVFDRNARPVDELTMDSLRFSGDVTDVAQALRYLRKERKTRNVQAAVLLTDGMVTEGGNPLYELEGLGIPLYTIGVGDTAARRDVRIHSVLSNSVAYLGTRVPVQVDVRSQGFAGERTEVLLRSEEGVVDRQVLDLEEGTRRYSVNLSITPRRSGMQRYTVELGVPSGDAVPANNRSSFFTKVLESKLNVVLLAGAPSADVAFIRRVLEGDGSLTVSSFNQQADGSFADGDPTSAVIDKANCLILVGYPTARSKAELYTTVVNAVRGGKGFLVVLSSSTDLPLLSRLETELPAQVIGMSMAEQEAFLSVVTSQRVNPLVRGPHETDAVEYWQTLAPVIRRDVRIVAHPEAQVLLVARYQNVRSSDPVYLSRSVAGHKSLLFVAYGLWRWNMHSAEGESDPLAHFLNPVLRWLSAQEEEKPLRVRPVKEVFSGQEPVEFQAQLYDATLQPVDDADVSITISGVKEDLKALAQPLGSGRYSAVFEGLGEGTYSFAAQAVAGGGQLGTDRGSFSVGELTVEYQDVRPRLNILQQLADQSGGKFYRPSDLGGLADAVASHPMFQSVTEERGRSVELWNTPWVLGLLVGMLALEWGLRKRSGML